jgi:hypothetical protein
MKFKSHYPPLSYKGAISNKWYVIMNTNDGYMIWDHIDEVNNVLNKLK